MTVIATHFNPYNTVTEDDDGVARRAGYFDNGMDIDGTCHTATVLCNFFPRSISPLIICCVIREEGRY